MLHAGVDIGSKTVKLVVLDDDRELLYDSYERHLSNVRETLGYTPVSYTHLDVYKRQSSCSWAGSPRPSTWEAPAF